MFAHRTSLLLEQLSFFGLITVLFGLGFFQGIHQFVFQLDMVLLALTLVWVDAAFAFIGFSASIIVFGALSLWALKNAPGPEPMHDSGTVTAIIPVYKDGHVLHKSVESLEKATYENVDTCIVCEPDDQESITAAERLAEERENTAYLINNRYPGSKAGAINYAAEETESPYLAVFDVDQEVEPGFIGRAVAMLQEHDIVQGRGTMNTSGIVESLAYYENLLLLGTGRLLSILFNYDWAGSATTVMKRSCFEKLGGYNTEVVMEDYEFSHRCYQDGVDVKRVITASAVEEPPHTLRDYWGQRKRWMIGQFQVIHIFLRKLVSNPFDIRTGISCLIALSTALGSLFLLTMIPKTFILLALDAAHLVALPLGLLALFGALFRIHETRDGPLTSVSYTWLLAPVSLLLIGLVTTKALPEYLFTWNGEWYHVRKGA